MKKWKKALCMGLCVVLFASLFGCSKKEHNDKKGNEQEESYQRTKLQLPEEVGQVTSTAYVDGLICVAGVVADGTDTKVWSSGDSGQTWEEQMSSADLTGWGQASSVFLASGGEKVILCSADGKVEHLYYVTKENEVKEFPIQSGNAFEYRISSDGTLYTYDTEALYVLDKESGTVLNEFHVEDGEELVSGVITGTYAELLVQKEEEVTLYQYDLKTQEKKEASDETKKYLEKVVQGYVPIFEGENQSVYIVAKNVAQYDVETEKLTTVMGQNDQYQSEGVVLSFAKHPSKDQFLVNSSEGLCLYEKVKGDFLTVYVLEEYQEQFISPMVDFYQSKYPGTKIRVVSGYSGQDGVTRADAIRNLNTEIMAGNGPDVLVLDGLPRADYIDKGILEPVDDVVKKVENKERLFDNLIQACNSGKKTYVVPLEFSVPMIIGDEAVVTSSMQDGLTELIQGKQSSETPVLSVSSALALMKDILMSLPDKLKKEDVQRYMEQSKILIENAISDEEKEQVLSDDSIVRCMEMIGGFGEDICFGNAQMGIGDVFASDMIAQMYSAKEQTKLQMGNLNAGNGNTFIASKIVGVNAKSDQKKEAKKFLEFILSEDCLKLSTDNFTINQKYTESMIETSDTGELLTTLYVNESDAEGFDIRMLYPAEKEEFFHMVEQLDTELYMDYTVSETILEQLQSYLKGEKSLEEAVNEAMQKLELYQAE